MAHVLVVDPGELGELLCSLLVQYGMSAEHARTGERALELALQQPPAAVIVEQDLTDAPGIDVAELLRAELHVKAILTYSPQLAAQPDDALLARIAKLDGSFLRPFRSLTLVEFIAKLTNFELARAPQTGDARLSSQEGDADTSPPIAVDDDLVLEVTDVDEDAAVQPVGRAAAPLSARLSPNKRDAFAPGQLTELWASIKQRRATPGRAPDPAGALSPRALTDVLDAFHQSQTTGELWLQNRLRKRVLYFRRGVITGARSNVEGEDVVALGFRRGHINAASVIALRDDMKSGAHKNVLAALAARNIVEHDTLVKLVTDHAREVATQAFLWSVGSFRTSFEGRATREPISAHVSVAEVVIRGILGSESDEALRQAAPDDARFTPASDAAYGLQEVALSDAMARVVVAMDGTKTIADLSTLFDHTPERIVRGLAAGLLCLGLVRFAGWGHASARQISYF